MALCEGRDLWVMLMLGDMDYLFNTYIHIILGVRGMRQDRSEKREKNKGGEIRSNAIDY